MTKGKKLSRQQMANRLVRIPADAIHEEAIYRD